MNASKPSVNPGDSAAQALRQFRVLFNSVRTHFRQVEKETGLGGAQVWALSLIQKNPGLGVGEVAAGMDTHQSTASNLIKGLLKKQLITLNKSAIDKRVVELRVTPEGKKALKKMPGPFEGVLPDALRRLDDTALSNLNSELAKLVRLLEADEGAGNIPLAQL